MKPTYSPAFEPRYPDYYILAIDDLVNELVRDWNNVIATEVGQVLEQYAGDIPPVNYPEIYKVNPITGDIRQETMVIDSVTGNCRKEVYLAQHYSMRQNGWYPDISFILHHVIDAIKRNSFDVEDIDLSLQLLEYDMVTMVHFQLAPNVPQENMPQAYSNAQMAVAKLARLFGRKLFHRLIEYGMYRNGHFPYHFAGWQGECAIVALDPTHQ